MKPCAGARRQRTEMNRKGVSRAHGFVWTCDAACESAPEPGCPDVCSSAHYGGVHGMDPLVSDVTITAVAPWPARRVCPVATMGSDSIVVKLSCCLGPSTQRNL
jgi:hypothetical protein